MALKKTTATAEETATVETPQEEVVETQAPQEETVAETAETKEVVVRQEAGAISTDVAEVVLGIFLQNEAIRSIVSDLDYGDFPVVKATNGGLKCDKDQMGARIKFIAHVAIDKDVLSPGTRDEEAKQYFAVSYDGGVTDSISGRPMQEILEEAKEDGYTKASIKTYTDLVVTIVECAGNPQFEDEFMILQLAPTSRRAFKKLTKKIEMRTALGRHNPTTAPVLVADALPESWDGNDYTRFDFSFDS